MPPSLGALAGIQEAIVDLETRRRRFCSGPYPHCLGSNKICVLNFMSIELEKSSALKPAAAQIGESDDFVLPVGPPAPPREVNSRSGENKPPFTSEAVQEVAVENQRGAPISASHGKFNIDDPVSWSAAAESGDALAMALLGDALCWGGFVPHGIFRDIPSGLSLLERSARLGHPLGLFMVSRAQRNIPGYRKHPKVADQTEAQAVSAGFLSHNGEGGSVWWVAEAMAHQEGRIAPVDENRQLALLRKSLNAGYTDAWTSYALYLIERVGTQKSINEGLEWLKRGAEMKNGNAMIFLADCYRNGVGVPTDAAIALTWYERAAVAGEDGAFNSLGFCSRKGIGCKKNESKAFAFYRQAAGLKNPSGLYNLGFCYENGIGVKVDKKSASFWYTEAISLGHTKALDGLKRVGKFK